jgi:L-threonylcarbamoyladenylate synthase
MIGTDIQLAAQLLEDGQLVAVPTETVYGLAGNALDESALAEIFRVKNRPRFDPLIVHLTAPEALGLWAREIPEAAQHLADAFMPGPLTLLLPKSDRIPDLVTSGSELVALRVPSHPMIRELLSALPFPLAAPSANPFGYISPTTAEHVARQLGSRIPYILDGGPCSIGLESTIVGFDGSGRPVVFRKGGIAVEALAEVCGPLEVRTHSTSNPASPGLLQSHYAPRTPLLLGNIPDLMSRHEGKKLGVLSFRDHYPTVASENQIALSTEGNYAEAAQRLFSAMRLLDEMGLEMILAEPLPEQDLGRAINDRLRRAAALG